MNAEAMIKECYTFSSTEASSLVLAKIDYGDYFYTPLTAMLQKRLQKAHFAVASFVNLCMISHANHDDLCINQFAFQFAI